jgi:hypothetical protein
VISRARELKSWTPKPAPEPAKPPADAPKP